MYCYKKILFIIIFLLLVTSCLTVKKVDFIRPVDTTTKIIEKQIIKDFYIEDMDLFASNKFTSSRINDFYQLNDSTVCVLINPENKPINKSPYYAFTTWSNSPKSIYYSFKYPEDFNHRYIPKLKYNDTWSIIDSTKVFNIDNSYSIKLDVSSNPITVAAQEIQSSVDVNNWVNSLIKNKDFARIKSCGKSKLGRNIPVIDIYKGSKKEKEIIVLLTRQHPPEVTGYYAFQSFLSRILNNDQLSDKFLNKYRILAFPIVNPDGVDLGHWRHNAGGVDTNRDWSEYNQPEIKNITRFITKASKLSSSKIIIGLDFHSTYNDVFYTNITIPTANKTTEVFKDKWFKSLEKKIPNYKVNEKSSDSKEPVSKGWFLYGHNAVGITYEIGDATPKDFINLKGRVSATEMMKILVDNNN